jgi:hypothetical protein
MVDSVAQDRQAGAKDELIQKVSDELWDWEGGSEQYGSLAERLVDLILGWGAEKEA